MASVSACGAGVDCHAVESLPWCSKNRRHVLAGASGHETGTAPMLSHLHACVSKLLHWLPSTARAQSSPTKQPKTMLRAPVILYGFTLT